MDWLTPPHRRIETPNRYEGAIGSPWCVQPVEFVVLHFTVGYRAEATAKYLANRARGSDGQLLKAKASAHFVVGRDGALWQLAPLSSRCWHAGTKGSIGGWRGMPGGANPRSIGIEMANLGPLFNKRGGWCDWWGKRWFGAPHQSPFPLSRDPDDHASNLLRQWCAAQGVATPEDTGGAPFADVGFEPFPTAQVEAVYWLVLTLSELFPVVRQDDGEPRIAAHSEIDPVRKLDPGPAFPLDELRARVQH